MSIAGQCLFPVQWKDAKSNLDHSQRISLFSDINIKHLDLTMSIGTSPRRTSSSSSSTGSVARGAQAVSSSGSSVTVVKRPGKRPGRKPSKVDEVAKLERSRQSARECRARKKLRYQYLEELVLSREKAVFALRDELETLKQWCLQLDSDGVIPEALLKVILSKDSRSQRHQHREEHQFRSHQNTNQQDHQQEHHQHLPQRERAAQWKLSSSSSSSDSETPKMSLQQQQQIQLHQWRQQQRQQQFSGSLGDRQGTSSVHQQHQHQQQRFIGQPRQGSYPAGPAQAPSASATTRAAPTLRRQLSVDLPQISQRQMFPQQTQTTVPPTNAPQYPRCSNSDSLFHPQTPASEVPASSSFMQASHSTSLSHPRHPVKQTSADSFFSPTSVTPSPSELPAVPQRQRLVSDTSFDSRQQKLHHPATDVKINNSTDSKPLGLFGVGGSSLYNAISGSDTPLLPSLPSVNLTTPVVLMDSSETDNEMTSQPLFQSTQSLPPHSLSPALRHTTPSPRPLTPIRRFPSPTPSSSSKPPTSPFDPHAQLRRLTNAHCYSATRTSNTPSPSPYTTPSASPYSGIPIPSIDMTPSPGSSASYRTSPAPLSSATPSPAPLMSLNTFLDMSASSLTSDLTNESTTGSDLATPPNFLFSQQQMFQQGTSQCNNGSSISESIPQFYSFLADLQDVEMTLTSRGQGGVTSSGQSTPSTLTQGSGDRVPTPEGVGEPLNLPTIIDDFLKNAHHGNRGNPPQ